MGLVFSRARARCAFLSMENGHDFANLQGEVLDKLWIEFCSEPRK
jgi:hypothetical protein